MEITGKITFAQAWSYGGNLMWVLAGFSVIALAVMLYLWLAQRSDIGELLVPHFHSLLQDLIARRCRNTFGIIHGFGYRIAGDTEFIGNVLQSYFLHFIILQFL